MVNFVKETILLIDDSNDRGFYSIYAQLKKLEIKNSSYGVMIFSAMIISFSDEIIISISVFSRTTYTKKLKMLKINYLCKTILQHHQPAYFGSVVNRF